MKLLPGLLPPYKIENESDVETTKVIEKYRPFLRLVVEMIPWLLEHGSIPLVLDSFFN